MKHRLMVIIWCMVGWGLAAGFLGCGRSAPPVPRSEKYGGQETQYALSDDESELFDILNTAYRRRTGRDLVMDSWLMAAARRMNWELRKEGFGFSGGNLWHQITHGDSIVDGITSPDAAPLASEAQRTIWVVGGTLAYPFVFTGLSAGFFDEFDPDRLSWDDILGFGCNVVGIGVSKQFFPPGRWVTFLFAERGIQLDEFPKVVDPSASYHLSGMMKPGYQHPELLVTIPNGNVVEYDMVQDRSGAFGSDVSFEGGAGQYLFEVAYESPSGPRVGALFPVSAGAGYPESYSLWHSAENESFQDADRAEIAMTELINQDRSRFRVPRVRQNVVLSRIARQYSQQMCDGKFLAHVTPEGQDLQKRLGATGILYQQALENVSVGYSIGGIEAGLMNSPGHRRNILDASVNQVGVGVVWTKGEDPPRAYVTQLFVKTFEKVDPDKDRERVLTEINRRRTADGIISLADSKQADAVAEEHCESLVNRDTTHLGDEIESEILLKLRRYGIQYRYGAVLVKQVGELNQLYDTDVLYDSTYTSIGIGLCQGSSVNDMTPWVWATILLFSAVTDTE
jgi:uncharacterized protein YkwD